MDNRVSGDLRQGTVVKPVSEQAAEAASQHHPIAPHPDKGAAALQQASASATISTQPAFVVGAEKSISLSEFMSATDRWTAASKGDVAKEGLKTAVGAAVTIIGAILSGPFAPLVLLGGGLVFAGRQAYLEKQHVNRQFNMLDSEKLNHAVNWMVGQNPELKMLGIQFKQAQVLGDVDRQMQLLEQIQRKSGHNIDFSKLMKGDTDAATQAKQNTHGSGPVVAGSDTPPVPPNSQQQAMNVAREALEKFENFLPGENHIYDIQKFLELKQITRDRADIVRWITANRKQEDVPNVVEKLVGEQRQLWKYNEPGRSQFLSDAASKLTEANQQAEGARSTVQTLEASWNLELEILRVLNDQKGVREAVERHKKYKQQ